jgi:hypothetical protein
MSRYVDEYNRIISIITDGLADGRAALAGADAPDWNIDIENKS